MNETTLNVPAEYVEAFRLGALAEVGSNAEWVASTGKALSERTLKTKHPAELNLEDLQGSARCLPEVIEIVEQVFAVDDGSVEVKGDASALAHIAETTARSVLGPRLSSELEVGPYDGDAVEKTGDLMAGLSWATNEAAALHALATAAQSASETEVETS